jgi:glycine oxidase
VETADVVIAGAGIIGLSLALDLATHGLSITVFERGRAMAESSWAAAGMLTANDPENPPQLAELANLSLALYPNYLAQIERLSGRRVPLRTQATILPISGEHAPDCTHDYPKGRILTRAEVQALVPALQSHFKYFILLDEASLDPRDLCAALPAAAIAAGVKLLENSPVTSIDAESARVVVQTPTTAIAATHFVNCAGAWAESPALGHLPPGHPRIAPAKGQMTTVRLRGPQTLTHVLRSPEIYLVPRGDGRIAIGATVEHAGFDKTVSPHAIAALLKAAAQLFPPIAEAEILESWAGLRPASADELPLIGPISHPIANVGAPSCGTSTGWEAQPPIHSKTWIATGHFRNGILLAPATARALSQVIRGEIPTIDLAAFAPNRVLPAIGRPLDRLVPPTSDNRSTAAL